MSGGLRFQEKNKRDGFSVNSSKISSPVCASPLIDNIKAVVRFLNQTVKLFVAEIVLSKTIIFFIGNINGSPLMVFCLFVSFGRNITEKA